MVTGKVYLATLSKILRKILKFRIQKSFLNFTGHVLQSDQIEHHQTARNYLKIVKFICLQKITKLTKFWSALP